MYLTIILSILIFTNFEFDKKFISFGSVIKNLYLWLHLYLYVISLYFLYGNLDGRWIKCVIFRCLRCTRKCCWCELQYSCTFTPTIVALKMLFIVAHALNILNKYLSSRNNARDFVSNKKRRKKQLMSYLVQINRCHDITRMAP